MRETKIRQITGLPGRAGSDLWSPRYRQVSDKPQPCKGSKQEPDPNIPLPMIPADSSSRAQGTFSADPTSSTFKWRKSLKAKCYFQLGCQTLKIHRNHQSVAKHGPIWPGVEKRLISSPPYIQPKMAPGAEFSSLRIISCFSNKIQYFHSILGVGFG